MGRPRRISGAVIAMCIAAIGSIGEAQTPQDQGAPRAVPGDIGVSFRPPPGRLIAAGKAPDLLILFSGDVIGYVDPCG